VLRMHTRYHKAKAIPPHVSATLTSRCQEHASTPIIHQHSADTHVCTCAQRLRRVQYSPHSTACGIEQVKPTVCDRSVVDQKECPAE
jgi:hypothetical protein